MNIGDASEKTGLPAKTIRYYEDIGLVIADRQPNGYIDYSAEHIERLSFLKRARDFGFPIEDCRKLLDLYSDHARHTSEVKALAAHHLKNCSSRRKRSKDWRRHCEVSSKPVRGKTMRTARSSQNWPPSQSTRKPSACCGTCFKSPRSHPTRAARPISPLL